MKKQVLIIILTLIFINLFSWSIPSKKGNVSDYIGLFSEQQESKIEDQIQFLMKNTGIKVAVVAINTSDEISPKQMTTEIFNNWGVGDKEYDNGLLILIAIDKENREGKNRIEIEPGYGLEGQFNDAKIGRLIDEYMMDYLVKKDYAGAVDNFLNIIPDYMSGKIEIKDTSDGSISTKELIFLSLFFVLIFPFIIVISILSRPKCKVCNVRMKMVSNNIITRSTYTSTGRGIKIWRCPTCGKKYEIPYIIAKRTRSSSSSGSGSGGGSSFGGGSSSGGGAGRSF